MAYATLGVAYSNQDDSAKASEYLKKAFELKDRASEREKLYISAHYYEMVTGEATARHRCLRVMERDLPSRRYAPRKLVEPLQRIRAV